MRETGLRYKGRRCPFYFENPRLESPLNFETPNTTVWVLKKHAEWLLSNNPKMFEVVTIRNRPKAIDIKIEDVPERPKPKVTIEKVTTEIPDPQPYRVNTVIKRKPGRPKGAKNRK